MGTAGGQRHLSKEDVRELRAYVLVLLRQLLASNKDVRVVTGVCRPRALLR